MKSLRSRVSSGYGVPWIRRGLLWVVPLGFLLLFFFFPLSKILVLGLDLKALSPAGLQVVLRAILFTFYQALLSTGLTLAVGLPLAWLFARFEFRGKSLLRALTAVPFMLPTVAVAAGFNALLGPRGWVNLGLMHLAGLAAPPIAFVGTLGAILLAHVFYNTTIVIRIVGSALARLDPGLGQTARSLGADPGRVLREINLPLLRPALLASALLVFLFDFTSFGVILLLGGPRFATLEVEIYIQALQLLHLPLAAWLSMIQLLCVLAISIPYSRLAVRTPVALAPRSAQSNLQRPVSIQSRVFAASMTALMLVLFILPMLALPLRSLARLDPERGDRAALRPGLTLDYYNELFINRRDSVFYIPPIRAALYSFGYAGITVVLSLALGFPVASALTRPSRLERILDPLIMLPLGASAVTLGLGFLLAFGPLLSSPWLVPLAHTLVALPFVVRTLQPALASIPDRLRQAACSLGASPWQVWREVDLPILARAALAAATFAFTISLGEFGATALLARPEYPTLPIAIYRFLSQPGGLNYGQAMAMGTLLMGLTTAGILLIERSRLPGADEF